MRWFILNFVALFLAMALECSVITYIIGALFLGQLVAKVTREVEATSGSEEEEDQ